MGQENYKSKVHQFFINWFNIDIIKAFPRYSTRIAKQHFGNRPVVCAEVGVYKGENANSILNELNVQKMYLIDPYLEWVDQEHLGGGKDQATMDKYKAMTHKLLKDYEDECVYLEKFSDVALNDIKEGLDYVYLDGNHDYEYIKMELEQYWNKLRVGGILAGHDIHLASVSKAVNEFCERHNLKRQYESYSDFVIVKEKGK